MCKCASNPCGCSSEINLPYLQGAPGANGANGTNGTNAPTVTSVTNSVSGNSLTLTFNFSNETSLSTVVNLATFQKAYILENFVANPLVTISGAGSITQSVLNVPLNTLSTNGDLVNFEYNLDINNVTPVSFDLVVAGTTIATALRFDNGDAMITGELTRVDATTIHWRYWTSNSKTPQINDEGHYMAEGFITVSNLATNAFTISLVGYAGTVNSELNRARTIVIKK